MATPLDTSLFGHFQILFPFLFILVLGYALFSKINLFGKDRKGLQIFLALLLAIMVLFSPIAVEIINTAAPWFIVFFFFIIFVLIGYMAMGADSKDIMGVLKSDEYNYINTWVMAIMIIIILGTITTVLARHGGVGSSTADSDSFTSIEGGNQSTVPASSQESDFWSTIFHPKVLGLVLIMLIAMFTIQRLVKE